MTVDAGIQLAAAKRAREAAHSAFETQLAQVRADLAARGIGGRVADRVSETAAKVADEAIVVADENKGVIAGTIAALVAWCLRKPIGRGVSQLVEYGRNLR